MTLETALIVSGLALMAASAVPTMAREVGR